MRYLTEEEARDLNALINKKNVLVARHDLMILEKQLKYKGIAPEEIEDEDAEAIVEMDETVQLYEKKVKLKIDELRDDCKAPYWALLDKEWKWADPETRKVIEIEETS